MATPMTATQVVAQLKKWGLKYVEIPGWATHNRNSKGAWGPVHGFVWHHTGADVKDARSYAGSTLYNGLSTLPGPLCHFSIGTDGTVYLVGWGRTNHAGGGDPAVLAHVQAEDYSGQLKPTRGNSNGVDGNAHFYGVEIQYSGSHEMSPAQYTAARRLSAAILSFHGWSERSVIGHGEWSSDKWDPGYAAGKIMQMPTVRADVKATLAAGPGKTTPPAPSKPAPSPAALTVQAIADAVWAEPLVSPTAPPGTNATRAAGTYLRWQDQHHAEVMRKLDDLTKAIEGLASAITKS
ncbi:N-acetylmuramoyl-L-alanine amidase [Streptomyces rubradiris]|uniref:N-acetylmuramoyl-L-alanine amidase domain-containing protein n=1 Tax=Streptomyces rubradiris TaxID=285531 RepID=A0ABQ3R3N7_STRRR|nr:peptidoglycan recognition family protein [Streptomyces rubradiris]GHH30296.1 hypothetical protein GCM10018792_76620 [Streptomyces rubradiris]GHI50443.1 hypothetical protein Srubr_02890 [Streptomyces rubradiris]